MPELRRDPVIGYWTIISTERSRRPMEFRSKRVTGEAACPFCEGNEREAPGEVWALRRTGTAPDSPGWDVRAIMSKQPILSLEREPERFGEGMYDLMEGTGRHEIIIENPKHCRDLDVMTIPEITHVIHAYVDRMNHIGHDDRFKYALLFKNHGLISGAAHAVVRHSRSQIIGMPITPKRVKEELLSAKNYFERRDRCVFCDILRQETSDGSRVVAQNEGFIAFCPFASRSPFEMWILPKHHCPDFGRLDPADFAAFGAILKQCLTKLRDLLSDPPYNFILHTAPYRHKKREVYWKTIEEDYHWYLHISPRLTHSAGFEWGTGIHINPTPPEDAAALLREVVASPEREG